MAIVVVTYQSAEQLPGLANAILSQMGPADEIAIIDNASSDDTSDLARRLFGPSAVIEAGANLGFAAGCHLGVEVTQAPLLCFLNPDSRLDSQCIERLRETALQRHEWSAWQATVLLDDTHINTSGGVIHYLGIGWAGDCGAPVARLGQPRTEIAFPSGAAMVVRREDWDALGGMDPAYFMYGEDLDFGLRLWLSGRRVGFVPNAYVHHDYEFDKGAYKWFWLERNRWRTILSVYPWPLLAFLLPSLLLAEIALLVIATRNGWLVPKLRSQVATLRDLRWIFTRRRKVQSMRCVSSAEFASHLTASLESPYLNAVNSPIVSKPQAFYWWLVRQLLVLIG